MKFKIGDKVKILHVIIDYSNHQLNLINGSIGIVSSGPHPLNNTFFYEVKVRDKQESIYQDSLKLVRSSGWDEESLT